MFRLIKLQNDYAFQGTIDTTFNENQHQYMTRLMQVFIVLLFCILFLIKLSFYSRNMTSMLSARRFIKLYCVTMHSNFVPCPYLNLLCSIVEYLIIYLVFTLSLVTQFNHLV